MAKVFLKIHLNIGTIRAEGKERQDAIDARLNEIASDPDRSGLRKFGAVVGHGFKSFLNFAKQKEVFVT